jgi:hypothetical protein
MTFCDTRMGGSWLGLERQYHPGIHRISCLRVNVLASDRRLTKDCPRQYLSQFQTTTRREPKDGILEVSKFDDAVQPSLGPISVEVLLPRVQHM